MAECAHSAAATALDEPTAGVDDQARYREYDEAEDNAAQSGEEEATHVDRDPFVDAQTQKAQKADVFVDESRYTRDANGEMILKWKVDYATRSGGGRATCKDLDCIERHDQGGLRIIEKGDLRIGRRVLMAKDGQPDQLLLMWYHARCIFNTFRRARQTTRIIESPEDLDGFGAILPEDQTMLRNIISGIEEANGGRKGRSTGSRNTPEKHDKRAAGDMDTPGAKRHKGEKQQKQPLRKDDRVWTFCRVRPAPSDRPAAGLEVAIKSARPELGIIREEEKDGCLIVQFETESHEKERIEKSSMKAYAKIRQWLRYPRVFEGKKQRVPLSWVRFDRTPPRLCGCAKQSWAHPCDCGIACTRGSSSKIWGVQ